MGLFNFGFAKTNAIHLGSLPVIWNMQLRASLYTEIQMRMIYSRILSDVITRSHKISEAFRPLLRASTEGDGQKGLLEYLVCSMVSQEQLVLRYEAGILHAPNYSEKSQIIEAWRSGQKPPRTLVLSFKNYDKSLMLRQYLLHKYLLLATEHKVLNLSSALQFKMSDLRSSVGLTDSDKAKEQAKEMADALLEGSPILLDVKDSIDLLLPDTGPLEVVAKDLQSEISLILGLPIAWVTGMQKAGLGDSGDADSRAIERGLEPYFWESIYPAFIHLFGEKLKFKSENYLNVAQGLDALRTFELVGDSLLSKNNQMLLVSKLLDLEPDGTEGQMDRAQVQAAPVVVAPESEPVE